MRKNNLFDEHTLDIVKAAMPHVHPRAQGSMNVLLKANDLMTTIEQGGNDGELSAMDMDHWTPEPEEMLLSIKEVANPGEVEIVDMILNFFKARKLFSAYQAYSDTVLEAQGLGGNGNGNGGSRRNSFNPFSLFGMNPMMNQRNQGQNANRNNGNVKGASAAGGQANNQNGAGARGNGMGPNNGQMPNFFNFMMSQMSPEQKQTFDMLNMMMNNMPNNPGNVSGQNVKKPQNNDKVKSQSLSEEETNEDNHSES